MMIDSSVLVAAFYDQHPHFKPSIAFLMQLKPLSAQATTHTLAETYTGITRMPIIPKPSPQYAMNYIHSMQSRLAWIALSETHYKVALAMVVEKQFSGAKIYDALILAAAISCKAKTLVTWNVKHFQPLAEGHPILVRTPENYAH